MIATPSPRAPQTATAPELPKVKAATIDDIRGAFRDGLADLRAAPAYGLFFGAFYALGGLLLVWLAAAQGATYAIYPLAAGFVLIGPFVAVGLYEVSRRRELGEPLSWGVVFGAAWRASGRQLSWMAFAVIFIFIMWMYQVRLLYALFFGLATLHADVFIATMLTTAEGWLFLGLGTAVGAFMALLTFSCTVVSFPMLLDRDVDWVSALITSIRTVQASPLVMLGFGALTAGAIFVAASPAFLGLIVVLPLWGHATWRLYRRLVAPS